VSNSLVTAGSPPVGSGTDVDAGLGEQLEAQVATAFGPHDILVGENASW
jgi:hypothetical protein